MAEGDTGLNAVAGGVFTTLTGSFVPLAPFFGGLLAGYLEGGGRDDGVRVGIYSGAIALVPALAGVFLMAGLLGVFGVGVVAAGSVNVALVDAIFLAFFFLAVVVLSVLYFVGLAAAGGWVGNYVKYDADF